MRYNKMANICNNDLIITGKKEDLETFKQFYKGTEIDNRTTWIDFNKIKSNAEDKERVKHDWEKLTDEEKKRWQNDFNYYWFNHGGINWQVKNWGTKWNPIVEEPKIHDGKLMYYFDTAWSPCDEIVRTLIEKHPELEFELGFEEWGNCFKGEITGENGEVMTDITENCDIAECPECEMTNLKAVDEEEFVCGDCGTKYKLEENEQ